MEEMQGPERVLPADSFTSTAPEVPVKLRRTDHPFDKQNEPVSIPETLKYIANKHPTNCALVAKDENGQLVKYTYKEYEKAVETCAKAFLKLGLERFHGVCIFGFNSPEWFISNFGAIYAGGVSIGIYITSNEEACFHVANYSRSNIIVLESEKQLKKILAIKSRLVHLKHIVQYKGEVKHEGVISWKQLMEMGKNVPDEDLENVLKDLSINQCCSMIFTSGTTGSPKASMLTHDNLIFDAKAIQERLNIYLNYESVVSYLPLSHIAAQIIDVYLMLVVAGTVYFTDESALRGTLVNFLTEFKPTRFFGVPRVWEKIQEKIKEASLSNGYIKSWLIQWAKSQAYRHNIDTINGVKRSSISFQIAQALVLKKVKQALGFDKCLTFAVGAAPLSEDVKKFFFGLNIPITEAFGLSEVAAQSIQTIDNYDFNSVGESLKGIQTKIINKSDGEGEICIYGRNVFMGYAYNDEETTNSIDKDGWFLTGDIGRIDENGLIFITGRKKDIIITAGGENVSPVQIEFSLLSQMPFLSNAVVIGDRRKYLSALLTLKIEINTATHTPTGNLMHQVQEWLKEIGCEATTITEVFQEPTFSKVKACIQQGIDIINSQAISNVNKIKKFVLLNTDFSIGGGELGPTLKMKRLVIAQKYKSIIDEIYS